MKQDFDKVLNSVVLEEYGGCNPSKDPIITLKARIEEGAILVFLVGKWRPIRSYFGRKSSITNKVILKDMRDIIRRNTGWSKTALKDKPIEFKWVYLGSKDFPIVLNNWSVISFRNSPFDAPELHQTALAGTTVEHPVLGKDYRVRTTGIQEVDGLLAKTKHHWYKLGSVDPMYRIYLKDHNIPFDEKNPIKLKTK
jgi:hypothetical protein